MPTSPSSFNDADNLEACRKRIIELEAELKKANQALNKSEERFQQLAENTDQVFWLCSTDRKKVYYISPAYEKIWGRSCASLYADPMSFLDALHPDDRKMVLETMTPQLNGKFSSEYHQEYRILRPDGATRWIRTRYVPIQNTKGEIYRIAGSMTDITSQKSSEQNIKEAEEKYRNLFEGIPDTVIVHDLHGDIHEVNNMACHRLGYARNELCRMNIRALLDKTEREPIEKNLTKLPQQGQIHIESTHLKKDGTPIPVEVLGNFFSFNGQPCCLSVIRDLTDRKRAEQALAESERRFRTIVEQAGDTMLLIDSKGKIAGVNTKACVSLGYSRQELLTLYIQDIELDFKNIDFEDFIKPMKTGEVISITCTHQRKDKTTFPVECRATKVIISEKMYLQGFARDVSERVKFEQKLHQLNKTLERRVAERTQELAAANIQLQQEIEERVVAEKVLRRIVDSNMIGILFYDANGEITEANKAYLDMVGYSREDLLARRLRWEDLTPPEFHHLDEKGFQEINARGICKPYEKENIHKDGSRIPILSGAAGFEDDTGRGVCFALDISEQKRILGALKTSEEKFRSIVETTTDWIWEMSPPGQMSYTNQRIHNILGYSFEEFTACDLMNHFHPKDRDSIKIRLQRSAITKKGWTNWLVRFRHKNGEYRTLESSAVPILDDAGELIGFRGVDRDVTERIKADEEMRLSSNVVKYMYEGIVLIRQDDGAIVYTNPSFDQMFGYRPGELIEQNISVVNAPTDQNPEEIAAEIIGKIIKTGSWAGEILNIRKDKTTFWCYARVSTFDHSKFGKIFLAIHENIHKRKTIEAQLRESLREKDTLLQEIHHRVKNNLQIVSSLLYHQSRNTSDPTVQNMFEESQERVRAIALIHETLYTSGDLSRINFAEYLKNLITALSASYRDRLQRAVVRTEIDKEFLNLDTAIPCGLLINELVTNALKYAFPEDRKGEIYVSFRKTKSNAYVLEIQDNGVGLPQEFDTKEPKTLGFKIVRTLVKQLDGKLSIQSKFGCTVFRVTFTVEA